MLRNMYGSLLINETIEAMFHMRTKRFPSDFHAGHVRRATNRADLAAALNRSPELIPSLSKVARHELACHDLPRNQPTISLSPEHRKHLQFDCLFRELQQSLIGNNMVLRRLTAMSLAETGVA